MTTDATTTARPTNPLLTAFGPGPLAIFATVVLPDPALRHANPALHARLHRTARELAAGFGVELGACGCCGAGIAEHVVGESHATGRRFACCRGCVRAHGGRSLNAKLIYMDKTRTGNSLTLERIAG